jgi:hypothetical protein
VKTPELTSETVSGSTTTDCVAGIDPALGILHLAGHIQTAAQSREE